MVLNDKKSVSKDLCLDTLFCQERFNRLCYLFMTYLLT